MSKMYDEFSSGRGDVAGLARKVFFGVVFFLFAISSFKLVESVDASEVVMIQAPWGTTTWYKTPGLAMQMYGKVYRYPKRGTIYFKPNGEGNPEGRLPIAFNDNGRAWLMGSMGYELPLVDEDLTRLHAAFPDQTSLENGLIKPSLNKSIFLTGTLMTSFESYKDKRSMLVMYVEDQAQKGVYRTQTVEREVEEESLDEKGQPVIRKKRVPEVIIVQEQGQPVRNEEGQMDRFKVNAFGFSIEDIDYDDAVTKQIQDQQAITMSVQTSIAKSKQAIQEAVTAEATGRANIATARAQQEIGKTEAVVQGEKQRDVAKLKSEEAEFYKKEILTRAEADAEAARKRLVADGALKDKLEAWKFAQEKWANAYATAKNVPDIVMGNGGGSNGSSSAQVIMDMLGAKMAKDLALEVKPGGGQ